MNVVKPLGAVALLALALAHAPEARAAASCMLLSGGGTLVDFGPYNAVDGHRDGIGQVQLLCVPDLLSGPTVSYQLSVGAGVAGSFNPRQLRAGANGLNYNLFRDSARTLVLGDGTPGTGRVAGSCAATCAVIVYGRIFGGQWVPAGQYRDDVLVTLDF